MNQLFASGHVIDLVIVVLALEVLLLRGVFKRAHVLPLPTLLAGLGLLLAWRLAQGGAGWLWVAVPLTAAGVAHGWDLWRRWTQPPVR
jgi:O-antigen ligase